MTLSRDGWTTDPPKSPGMYWFIGADIMGAMGIDHTDEACCDINIKLVKVCQASNSLVAIADGHFIGLKRFQKGNRIEGHIGWWKPAEIPRPPTDFEEAFEGFKIKDVEYLHNTEISSTEKSPSEKAFRQLRECWFNDHLQSRPSAYDYEDETKEELRERSNSRMKTRYDEDTEAILRGEDRPINPRCGADLSNYTK